MKNEPFVIEITFNASAETIWIEEKVLENKRNGNFKAEYLSFTIYPQYCPLIKRDACISFYLKKS